MNSFVTDFAIPLTSQIVRLTGVAIPATMVCDASASPARRRGVQASLKPRSRAAWRTSIMSEREPTSEPPTRADSRVACSTCQRVFEYSGDRPRFCAYCGVALEQTEAGGSTTTDLADPYLTRTYLNLAQTASFDSSSPRNTAPPEEFPDRIADYRLVRRLGSGGMGTVFEAIDERQGQRVALKLIARHYVASDEALQRFRQEGRTASAVTHPRCVFVLAVDEDQGRPYLVMELMPGTTLQSLVDHHGALEPSSALVKIFDVIEGLEEFHKLGMIHRDVKPSNCFLDAEGRVKIGDFGLSKSLEGGLDLTRTGAFLGTPLYASPEQIKRDALDQRTDVYSVAATLYFLLTKRPPIQTDDAAEALARIASEPAPPVRTFAPHVPRGLEAVIHKGLERDRTRRWRSLREFHNALLPFVPERLGIGTFGLRIGAQALDLLLFYLAGWAMFAVGMLYFHGRFFETFAFFESRGAAIAWGWRIAWIAYFALAEGLCGASLGKWVAGLRVARSGGGGVPPGLGRGLVRILCFYLFIGLGGDVLTELFATGRHAGPGVWYWVGFLLVKGLGMVALLATMRRRSGFRGPHEWLSGTRVVQVARGRRVRALMRRIRIAAGTKPTALAAPRPLLGDVAQVGPYRVHGAILSSPRGKILLGQDSTLDRQVWILLRPPNASPPEPPRRALNRLTRPRWIGGGDQPEGRWDAFTAPSGMPLTELVETGGLPWADVLTLLTDLAEEVEAARADDTFPPRLSAEHVWVQRDGRVQIIDPLGWDDAPDRAEPAKSDSDEIKALAFLRDVARLSLEGGRTSRRFARKDAARSDAREPVPPAPRRIHAAVPERAGVILERLAEVRPPYPSLAALRADLIAASERPTEVTAARRMVQLAIQAFLLSPGLLVITALSCPKIRPGLFPWDLQFMLAVPLMWVMWAILMRGGLSFPLTGLSLVRGDGRAAKPLTCGLRTLLVWAPPITLFAGSRYLQRLSPEAVMLAWSLWIAGVLLLVVFVAITLWLPNRGPHDRLSGTVVVPI
jgi:eukaryotic-like serine/threonine-protein kinase